MRHSLLGPAVALIWAVAGPAFSLDLGDGTVHLRAGSFAAHEGPAASFGPRAAAPWSALAPDHIETALVVIEGRFDAELRSRLTADGRRIVGFVPSNGVLLRGPVEALRAASGLAGVLRVEDLRSGWKVSPELDRSSIGLTLHVEVFRGESADEVAAELTRLGAVVLAVHARAGVNRVVVRADGAQVDDFAPLSAVEWIEPRGELTLRNDEARWVIQSNVTNSTPLHDAGLFGRDQILGHIDGPIDTASCFFRDDLPPGPGHRKLVAWRNAGVGTRDTHGTHTAGTLAGENEDANFPEHRGMAPKARIAHTDWSFLNGEDFNGQPSNVAALLQQSHQDGARIHSNSWGRDNITHYTTWSRDVDAFTWAHEEDLVCFAVTNTANLATPENAKNCLAVGATARAPNQDFHAQGGDGPTSDGRRKPEVYAPGQATRSAAPNPCGTSMQTGTSMACPAVAGGAALVREYFQSGYFPTGRPFASDAVTPTGALLKAILINSTVDLTGVLGYPSNREGWGRIRLDDALYFAGDRRRLWYRDVRHADGLEAGESREWTLRVRGSGEPLKITLAYTEPPATPMAEVASLHDLSLEVEGPDGTFLGNVIDDDTGESVPGGGADEINNVERVLVAVPTPGTWTIRVRGTDVPMGPQGFAVVANGDFPGRSWTTGLIDDPREGPDGRAVELAPFRPNPFRGGTELSFRTAVPGPTRLELYDVQGRRVRVLLDRPVAVGSYTIPWDGRDESGRHVSPGLYFGRLTAPGMTRTVRGVLLR